MTRQNRSVVKTIESKLNGNGISQLKERFSYVPCGFTVWDLILKSGSYGLKGKGSSAASGVVLAHCEFISPLKNRASEIRLSMGDISGCQFFNMDRYHGVSLFKMSVHLSTFSGASLQETEKDTRRNQEVRNWRITDSVFQDCEFAYMTFVNSTFENSIFFDTGVVNCEFRDCTFENCHVFETSRSGLNRVGDQLESTPGMVQQAPDGSPHFEPDFGLTSEEYGEDEAKAAVQRQIEEMKKRGQIKTRTR